MQTLGGDAGDFLVQSERDLRRVLSHLATSQFLPLCEPTTCTPERSAGTIGNNRKDTRFGPVCRVVWPPKISGGRSYRSSCNHGPEPRERNAGLLSPPGRSKSLPVMFTAIRKPAGNTMHIGQISMSSS